MTGIVSGPPSQRVLAHHSGQAQSMSGSCKELSWLMAKPRRGWLAWLSTHDKQANVSAIADALPVRVQSAERLSWNAGPPMTEAQAAKKFPLLAPALQGLTRYAHLISVEYFSDLLTVMQQIGNAPGLPLRTRLQCILTASDILK